MPSPRIAGPEPPPDAPVASDEALQSFTDKVQDLGQSPPIGPFSVTFTEAELTSALAEALAQQEAGTDEALPVQNPQVLLRDGQISVYMTVQLDGAQVNGLVTAHPAIDANGLVDITVTGVEFGPIVLDPAQFDALTAEMERTINDPIQASPTRVVLTEIVVSGGQMTVSGATMPLIHTSSREVL
jgi:hypothetical protein